MRRTLGSMGVLLAIAAAVFAQAPAQGIGWREAEARVRGVFTILGGIERPQDMRSQRAANMDGAWWIEFKCAARKYYALVDASGRVKHLDTSDATSGLQTADTRPDLDSNWVEVYGAKLLQATGETGAVGKPSKTIYVNGQATINYPLTANGYRFFFGSTNYRFRFTREKMLLSYSCPDPIPPIYPGKPRLTGAEAIEYGQESFREIAAHLKELSGAESVEIYPHNNPEIGYLLATGSSQARLAWRIECVFDMRSRLGHATQQDVYIDAIGGQRLLPVRSQ